MSMINSGNASFFPGYPGSHNSLSDKVGQQAYTSYQEENLMVREADITLKTEEGDVVHLSRAQANGHSLSAENMDKVGQKFTMSLFASESYEVSVQGDLSEEELSDIYNLMDKFSSIAADFYSGDLVGALEGGLNLGDTGSVSQFNASFTQSSTFAAKLTEYHPLPNLSPEAQDSGGALLTAASKEEEDSLDSLVNFSDLLRAQWEQISEMFEHREELANEKATQAVDSRQKVDKSLSPVKQMIAAAEESMTAHPRLTPFIPSLAEIAIDEAVPNPAPKNIGFLQSTLKNSFFAEFGKWLGTA